MIVKVSPPECGPSSHNEQNMNLKIASFTDSQLLLHLSAYLRSSAEVPASWNLWQCGKLTRQRAFEGEWANSLLKIISKALWLSSNVCAVLSVHHCTARTDMSVSMQD